MRDRPGWLMRLLCGVVLLSLAAAAQAAPWSLFGPAPVALATAVETFVRDESAAPPPSYEAVADWKRRQQLLPNVGMHGGRYWLAAEFVPDAGTRDWVVAFGNTYFERAELWVLGSDGSVQRATSGIGVTPEYQLHRGRGFRMQADVRYAIVVDVRSRFFTSLPRLDVFRAADYERRVINENVLILLGLGGLLALGVFNLFLGLWTHNRSYVLYGGQSLSLVAGWGFYFNLPYDWLGISSPHWNFAPWFFLLTAFHAAFCVQFLDLRDYAPRMARLGRQLAIGALALMPICWLTPSWSHSAATLVVGAGLSFVLASGILALRQGVRRARFFIAAYVAILIPGVLILPANLGIVPDAVDNTDLVTLIGNAVEAMLLGFALADHLRIVERTREEFRQRMQQALVQASTDSLTGLGNRYAFNLALEAFLTPMRGTAARQRLTIAMIDLDGLKSINDNLGHAEGDALIAATGRGLARLHGADVRAFRLGGDEFAVIAPGDDLSRARVVQHLVMLEQELRAGGFPAAGLSYGLCTSGDHGVVNAQDLADLLRLADERMYAHKLSRRPVLRAGALFDP